MIAGMLVSTLQESRILTTLGSFRGHYSSIRFVVAGWSRSARKNPSFNVDKSFFSSTNATIFHKSENNSK